MNSSTVEASITPSSSPSSLSGDVVTTSTSTFPSTSPSTFTSTSTPASPLSSSSLSNLISSISSTGKIFIIGIFIIVIVGLFYFVKLLICKRKKRINKDKKLRRNRSGNYDNKHNPALNLSGTNRSNSWTPFQEEEMMGRQKKVTAADHLNSVKKNFNRVSQSLYLNGVNSNSINKKKRKENIDFELECEKLNNMASRNVHSKIYDSFNDLSSSGSSSNNTTRPIRDTLTNNIESPQPVHFRHSSPLAP